MDSKLSIPWSRRIQNVRYAAHYGVLGFSRIFGVNSRTIKNLESGSRPSLTQIRRIRQLERIFSDALTRYLKDCKRWGRNQASWEQRDIVYDDYEGRNFRTVTRTFGQPLIPTRPQDIEALGGMEVLRRAVRLRAGKREYSVEERKRRGERIRLYHRGRVKKNEVRALTNNPKTDWSWG